MRILICHNRYALRGGEDEAFASEASLLERRGHAVLTHTQENIDLDDRRGWQTGLRALWSRADYGAIRAVLRERQISLVSVHNFFPLISPSIYYAARAEGIPVVQTLHNYRLLCPAATFLRGGLVCEDCLNKPVAWPGIVYGCYRGSRARTAAVAAMTSVHRGLGTWSRVVTCYVALTSFMQDKFVQGGFPADRIFVKPNSVEETGLGDGRDGNFLFVGRLSKEKGVHVLLRAWAMAHSGRKLKIIGTGPEELQLRSEAQGIANVEFLGEMSSSDTRDAIGRSAAIVFPSIWYEGLSRVITEAFSKGTPVIASDIGPMRTILPSGAGVLFRTGDAEDLAEKIQRFPLEGSELTAMRVSARSEYEAKYCDDVVYKKLIEIYGFALANRPEICGPTSAHS